MSVVDPYYIFTDINSVYSQELGQSFYCSEDIEVTVMDMGQIIR